MKIFLSRAEIQAHEHRAMERKGRYYNPSFDSFRIICLFLIVLATFGAPIPYFDYVRPFLGFTYCTLFTIYGYTTLRSDVNLVYHIRKTFQVFLIMFASYLAITFLYMVINGGVPMLLEGNVLILDDFSTFFTKRNLFNFVVLNYWPTPIGESIWYIQATLYALVFFWLTRKIRRFDWLICIITFAITLALGEFSDYIGFSFFGNTTIPGNFLTRAIPYMLLGRLIYRNEEWLLEKFHIHPLVFTVFGIGLAVLEYFILDVSGHLVYVGHFVGFILVSASLCFFAATKERFRSLRKFEKFYPTMLRGLYYTFNPIGYFFISLIAIFATAEIYDAFANLLGIILIVFIPIGCVIFYNARSDMKAYDRRHSDEA